MRRVSFGLCLGVVILAAMASAPAAEPKWQSLLGSIDPAKDSVVGEWKKAGDSLTVAAAQGARLALPVTPPAEYDLRATFTRRTGQHSIGLIVVHGTKQAVFEADAWGSHLGGFQNINGRSIQQNPTRRERVQLENGKRHTITVEVRKGVLRGLLDGKEIARYETDGRDLSLPDLWSLRDATKLGLVAWECDTTFHAVEIRSTTGEEIAIARTAPARPATPASPTPPTSTTPPAATTPRPSTPKSAPANANANNVRRVLIVIANHHFFYREYGDPRQELERAGFRVVVAAGRKAACRPHQGSGEGADGGVVQADLALSDVKADDYEAVLFSGGWGASAYQFAFPGRYNDTAYNGERAVKAEANRVINDFLAKDKYVCALCNGVSALAWARVDGKSPLAGSASARRRGRRRRESTTGDLRNRRAAGIRRRTGRPSRRRDRSVDRTPPRTTCWSTAGSSRAKTIRRPARWGAASFRSSRSRLGADGRDDADRMADEPLCLDPFLPGDPLRGGDG